MSHFAGNTLDRQSARRSKVAELAAERRKQGRFLAVSGLRFLQNEHGRVAWLEQADLEPEATEAFLAEHTVYLGMDDNIGRPYWAVDVTKNADLFAKLEQVIKAGTFVDLRPAAFTLPTFEAALVAQGCSLLDWHARYSGYKRVCTNTACASHKSVQNYSYPRTDAAIITVVTSPDGQRALLGRQKRWPPKMYSCVAGFMEPGESIEEACRREVHEETGVRVGAVAYHSSQPWPFPSQLMIGCFAEATSDTITLVDGELEDAKWFSREEIRDAIAGRNGELKLASGASISFALIRAWAEGPIKARI